MPLAFESPKLVGPSAMIADASDCPFTAVIITVDVSIALAGIPAGGSTYTVTNFPFDATFRVSGSRST